MKIPGLAGITVRAPQAMYLATRPQQYQKVHGLANIIVDASRIHKKYLVLPDSQWTLYKLLRHKATTTIIKKYQKVQGVAFDKRVFLLYIHLQSVLFRAT